MLDLLSTTPLDAMPHTTVIDKIDRGMQGGKTGFVLEWNTSDRLFVPDEGVGPISLHLGLAQHFDRQGYHCGLYTQSRGLEALAPPEPVTSGTNPFQGESAEDLSQITPVLRSQEDRAVLFVQYADLLLPEAQEANFLQPEQQRRLEIVHRWGTDDRVRQGGNAVILIAHEESVSGLLTQSGAYKSLQVPLPERETRSEFIDLMIDVDDGGGEEEILDDGFQAKEMARMTNGLRLRDIETLFRSRDGEPITRPNIQELKGETIRDMAGGLVEIAQPDRGFESIVGMESVKAYFHRLQEQWQGQAAETMSDKLILAGVPGQGKSYLCRSLAKEMELPLLIIRNLHGRYVGESEANMERVLSVVDTMSPCIVIIEELDQWGIGQRSSGPTGDSGTTSRMTQRFWEELGDSRKRGNVLWIATSNRPDLLDAAMLDRFQVVIPFIHPTPPQVADLLEGLADQLGRELADDVDPTEISQYPNLRLPTVRNLREIMSKAARNADMEAGEVSATVHQRHLSAAARDYVITYDRAQHVHIALTAIQMTPFRSLYPWMDASGKRREDVGIPQYLDDLVREDGHLDREGLSERIQDYQQQHLGTAQPQ